MKHPILHIRKGVEAYDDEAEVRRQESRAAAPEKPPVRPGRFRGVFRKGRGPLLPVLILVIAALLILRMVPRSVERANIDGLHALLQARVMGRDLLVGVAFSRLPGSPDTPAAATAPSERVNVLVGNAIIRLVTPALCFSCECCLQRNFGSVWT